MNPNKLLHEKIIKVYNNTLNNYKFSYQYNNIDKLDLFKVFYKATEYDLVHRIMGCNMFMMNSTYNKNDSVLIVFMIPLTKEIGNKAIADQVMEIVENIEICFTTVDYLKSFEKKEDKHVYVMAFKNKDREVIAA